MNASTFGSYESEERKQRLDGITWKIASAVERAGWHLGQHVRASRRTRTEPGHMYIGAAAERWYNAWGKGDEQLAAFEKAEPANLFITVSEKSTNPNVSLGNFEAVVNRNAATEIWQVIEGDRDTPMKINMFECCEASEPMAIDSSNLLPELSPPAIIELMESGSCTDPCIGRGSPDPKYPVDRKSSTDVQEIIGQGPVLSLDIDGVLAPVRQGRSPFPTTPPGFVCGAIGAEVHQAMNDWLCRLAEVFPTIVWNSSWGGKARQFAQSTGLTVAVDWPSIYGELIWGNEPKEFLDPPNDQKLHLLMTMIDPHVPLAVLDDQHVGNRFNDSAGECLLSRPGPTLVVAPNSQVGIGASLVDKLVEWAREPYHTEAIMGMYGHEEYFDSPCFWRHGNCADPYGYGQPGTGWVERENGRPDEAKLTSWRKGWWNSVVHSK